LSNTIRGAQSINLLPGSNKSAISRLNSFWVVPLFENIFGKNPTWKAFGSSLQNSAIDILYVSTYTIDWVFCHAQI